MPDNDPDLRGTGQAADGICRSVSRPSRIGGSPIASRLIAIDLGTTTCKAGAFLEGRLIATASRPIETVHPAPGQAEQDPESWVAAVSACVRDVGHSADFGSVDAVGLTAQSDTLVVVGADGRATRPALLWMDTRGAHEAAEFEAAIGRAEIHRRTGLRSAFNYTGAKAAWVRRAEAATFDRARWLLQPKDFLCLRLTGAAV